MPTFLVELFISICIMIIYVSHVVGIVYHHANTLESIKRQYLHVQSRALAQEGRSWTKTFTIGAKTY